MTPRDDQRKTDDVVAAEDDTSATSGDADLAFAGLPAETETGEEAAPPRRASLAHRLYNGEAGLNVVGRSKIIYRITAVVLAVCVVSFIVRGFNFGIEFVGGDSFQVPGTSAQLSSVQAAAQNHGAQVSTAQIVGGNQILLRTGQLSNAKITEVQDAVAQAAGVRS